MIDLVSGFFLFDLQAFYKPPLLDAVPPPQNVLLLPPFVKQFNVFTNLLICKLPVARTIFKLP